MTRPVDPNISIPSAFAINGTKTDFTNEKIQDGFDDTNPDILAGDNLNKFIDDTYKGLNYSMDGVDDLYDVTDGLKDLSNLSANGQAIIDNKASKDLNNLSATGEAHFVNPDLSNLSNNGSNRLHALKGYLDDGELLTDAEGLADVKTYAHSSFDLSKFTVVGTPTITDDGIASGLKSGNSSGVRTTINASNLYGHSFKFTSRAIVQKGKNTVFFNFHETYHDLAPNLHCKPHEFVFDGIKYLKDDDTVVKTWVTSSAATYNNFFTDDNPHWCTATAEFDANTNIYSATLINEDNNQKLQISKQITDAKNNNASSIYFEDATNATVYIGNNSFTNESDTIDLKYFSITADGVEVFSGNKTGIDTYTIGGNTVTIPYTLSKTGSKIADVSVRPRVTDMYEQFGYAPYYTLDEANGNFTLPQGEIYGMMLNQSVPHIIETYQNGTSGYVVYSNGYCEQWGRGVTDESGNLAVFLLKEFRDTNYIPIANQCHGTSEVPSVVYADIAATDYLHTNVFRAICSTNADTPATNVGIAWIAKGYINL